MGGKLQVESEKGQGSRFYFTLEFETTDVAILSEEKKKIFINPEALKGRFILVVEDNEFNQFIARSILVKWNAMVDIASNGKEAIAQIKEKNYDLILMDMQMPVMDGLTATRIMRREMNNSTPVIALTAYATKDAIEKALDAGMNGYLTKPFEEETLFSQLLSTLDIPLHYISDTTGSPQNHETAPDKPSLQYDLSKLSKLVGDDRAEIIYLLEQFVDLIPEYSSVLFTAFEQNNIGDVEKSAHKIKASLELIASGNLCSNIKLINEYSRKKENLEKLPKLVKYYRDNVAILISQLSVKVAELKKGDG
jgi:CheY-like chemotaxis protein/HPt (histidine-containing phosphotransfer) domain-containing protein